jgi:2-keto-3-deoxy-L-rhamnonate aldolase RhmA
MKTFLFYTGWVIGIWVGFMLMIMATIVAASGFNILLRSWGM